MNAPKIAQKSPYVRDELPGKKFWCACGQSANQPYCDGSHKRLNTGISPLMVDIKEAKKVAWCGCKHTKNPPFCDGSHTKLA